jgi:hypothetical protein
LENAIARDKDLSLEPRAIEKAALRSMTEEGRQAAFNLANAESELKGELQGKFEGKRENAFRSGQ